MDINKYIATIPDFPEKGVLFYDLAPLLLNYDAWNHTISKISDIAQNYSPNLIAGIEARGFLVSSPLSLKMGLGSVLVRKKGKTPGKHVAQITYDLEYGTDTLEINSSLLQPQQKVIIVDDVLATGGTINATVKLLKQIGCTPVGVICILELTKLKGRANINIPVHTLLKY